MTRDRWLWTVLFLAGGAYIAYRLSSGGMGYEYVERVNGSESPADASAAVVGTAAFDWPRTIGLWTAAIFTLCIFSFLYRDNPFYKFAEAVVVGVSAAYWMVVGFWTVLVPNLFGELFPAWIQAWAMPGLSPVRDAGWYMNFVPLLLGAMLLWRLAPSGGWISRWPLAFIIGVFAGLRLIGFLQADFLSQIRNGIVPLVVLEADAAGTVSLATIDYSASIMNLLLIVGVLVCLVYFFFSIEHKGVVGRISQSGIWVLMITFGAGFAFTVMGRIALLAIRLEFLFDDWLWLIDPTGKRIGL